MDQRNGTISIVTDSGCDLPLSLLNRFNIDVVPLAIHFGSEEESSSELSMDVFWRRVVEEGHVPQTSTPSVGAFEEVFGRLVEQGKRVLYITLTGKHTGTIETARLAARRFGEAVRIFDSQSLSLGQGFQVLEAARASEIGLSMEELLDVVREARSRVHLMVVLDTLDSVRRGGRADAFIAGISRVARTLNIKPIVNFVEGRLQLVGIARSFRRAIERILDTMESLGPLERLAVVHARNAEIAERLADRLAERLGFSREQIMVGETGAVVASHAGAGAVGVFALTKGVEEGVREGGI